MKWYLLGIIFLVLLLLVVIGAARVFTGEDTWICEDGQWVEHGLPAAPMPTTECPKR